MQNRPPSSSPRRIAQPRPVNGVPSAPSPPSQENSTAGFPPRLVVRQSIKPWMYPNWKEPRPVSSNSKNAWTSSSRYSSSQADIERMRQRPVKGNSGFGFATLPSSGSSPVPEPVAVVPDQLAIPHCVIDLGQRYGERSLTVPSFTEQPLVFIQVVLLGVKQSVHGQRHAIRIGHRP